MKYLISNHNRILKTIGISKSMSKYSSNLIFYYFIILLPSLRLVLLIKFLLINIYIYIILIYIVLDIYIYIYILYIYIYIYIEREREREREREERELATSRHKQWKTERKICHERITETFSNMTDHSREYKGQIKTRNICKNMECTLSTCI